MCALYFNKPYLRSGTGSELKKSEDLADKHLSDILNIDWGVYREFV